MLLPLQTPRRRSRAVAGAQVGGIRGKKSKVVAGKPGDMRGKEKGNWKMKFPGGLPY